MIVIINPYFFWFNFDLPKDIDENLNCETEFMIKCNISLDYNNSHILYHY